MKLADHVTDDVGSERLQRLIDAVRGQTRRKNLERVGTVQDVLVEQPAKRGGMLGRTRTNLMVLMDVPEDAVGEYHQVRLTGTTGSTFTGTILTRSVLAVL